MTALDRFRNGSSFALCAVGIGLLSYWLSAMFDAHMFQSWLADRLETTGSSGSVSSVLEGASATRREATTSGLVGRLEIPRLGISAMVTEGITKRALGRGIGHVPDTAFPGERGNVGLAAHRDTYFRGLKDVATGDRIRLVTPGGAFLYKVEWARIVHPDRIDLLEDTVGPALTLVTCYPFHWIGSAPQRFVVRCRPIGEPAILRVDAPPMVVATRPPDEKDVTVPIAAPDEAALEAVMDSMNVLHEAAVPPPEEQEGPAIAGPLANPLF
ncbi:MAG: class D sortase [Candidatus Eiseniibacteriota bacterium]